MATATHSTLADAVERLLRERGEPEGFPDLQLLAEDIRMMEGIIAAIRPVSTLRDELRWLTKEYGYRTQQLASEVAVLSRWMPAFKRLAA